ncbi:hypothetical protein [Nonomuraea rubra]|uniref:Uncharacterized protein n=1 Tax=Nonomuraea rubra TaxID=46180 RepID=A0A7X0U118_9ACTN|nr:hypothetical protein [Nonomuraea rubra]MBB6551297.1 hypothetical protein [Nonomuraea rubra]
MSATGGSACCQQRRTGRVEVDVTAEEDVVDREARTADAHGILSRLRRELRGGPSPAPPSARSHERPVRMTDCVTQHPRTATAPEIWPRPSMRSNTSDK